MSHRREEEEEEEEREERREWKLETKEEGGEGAPIAAKLDSFSKPDYLQK